MLASLVMASPRLAARPRFQRPLAQKPSFLK